MSKIQMRWLSGLLFGCAVLLAQMHSAITRERGEFVQTTTGRMSVPEAARFRVSAAGTVVVHGGSDSGISYVIRQRVKADSDAEARQLLRNIVVRNLTKGGWNTLSVLAGDPSIINTEMYLTVPKSLRESMIISRGGNVEAYDLDGNVQAETPGGRIQMDRIGGNAEAQTGGSDIRIGRVGGILRCFSGGGSIQVDSAGGETWCETAGGEIGIGECSGVLHATTAGGSIRVRRVSGSVIARSDGGLIEIGRAGGVVTAETRGGSIEVGKAPGAQCESAAGAIRVRGVGGPLRAQTAIGSIMAELLPGIRLEESNLNTGSGDITVFIPSNVAVSVQALSDGSNRMHRIVSDFPEIRVKPRTARVGPIIAEGSLNGGGPLLRITANSGTIYLRRPR
jgi:DUF4097 and DUF4098 domain-containing protein YvlB